MRKNRRDGVESRGNLIEAKVDDACDIGQGALPKFPRGQKQLGEHFGGAFTKNRLFIMGVKDEMFGQFMQFPLTRMPCRGSY